MAFPLRTRHSPGSRRGPRHLVAAALVAAVGLGGAPLEAQGRGGAVRFSAQAVLGRADAGYTVAFTGSTSFGGYVLTLRWSETSRDLLEGGTTFREIAGLVGHAFPAGPLEVHIAAGLGRVVCNMVAECAEGPAGGEGGWRRSLASVPLQAQVALPLLGALRLGVQGFGSLNEARSYGGAALFLQFGFLR